MQFDYIYGINVEKNYSDIQLSIEMITPDTAMKMLETNTHNRTLGRVTHFKSELSQGEWMLNGQTIVFSDDGVLLDGQHRLQACASSGVSFTTVVVRGIRTQAQTTMDSGTKRGVITYVQLQGYENSAIVASAGAALCEKEQGRTIEQIVARASTCVKPTIRAIVQFIEDNYETRIKPIVSYCSRCTHAKIGLQTRNMALIFDELIQRGAQKEDIDEFVSQLVGTENPCDTVFALRRRLIGNVESKQDKLSQRYITAIIIKAWNAFIQGKDVTLLAYKPGGAHPEKFPEIIVE